MPFIDVAAAAAPVVHVSTTDWPTLILAAAGTALALASLGWQWYSIAVLSGSRVRVEIRRGLRGVGAVVTFPETAQAWHVDQAMEQGYTEPILGVVVRNVGRSATSITSVDLAFSDGGALGETNLEPSLPLTLEGEHSETWYFAAGPAIGYTQTSLKVWPERASNMTVRGRVQLGSGKTIVSEAALSML